MKWARWFFGTWAVIVGGFAFLFWPLAVWPDAPQREFYWFLFLTINIFAALIASERI